MFDFLESSLENVFGRIKHVENICVGLSGVNNLESTSSCYKEEEESILGVRKMCFIYLRFCLTKRSNNFFEFLALNKLK